MHILKVFFILLEVLLLFNLLIFVHELGHYLAARWRGLKIERFAVWFGKPIWRKRIGDVEYALGCIPAGGYMSLPQMAPMDVIEGKTASSREELPPISPLDKIIVAFAGPLFSFGLALLFGCVVWVIGRPISESETTTTVGYVAAMDGTNWPAKTAGIKPGDKILAIDGRPVTRFAGIGDSVQWRIVSSEGETIAVTVQRGSERLTFNVNPIKAETARMERRALREIGILPAYTAIIARLFTPPSATNSPAERAGLRPNDIVLAVNGEPLQNPTTGEPIQNPAAVGDFISAHPTDAVVLRVRRGSNVLEKSVVPVMAKIKDPETGKEKEVPMIGVAWEHGGKLHLDNPDPITQVSASVSSMINTFAAIISPKSDIGPQHLSGPVGIIRIYYRLFESEQGWRLAIWFSVILNVNLALLNLLPIPVLDGGHITLALVEAIRRRPVNVRLVSAVQTACAVLLIGYILYVTFYDAQDWRGPKGQSAPPAQKQK